MALTEETVIDKIEVVQDHIQVREATIIKRDGEEISQTYRRWTIPPNGDLTGQDPKVVAVAQAAWGAS